MHKDKQPMAHIVLFTGGARSGKSTSAERYVALQQQPVVYVATAEAGDDEMRHRIALHQTRRPDSWRTIEAPLDVAQALGDVAPGTVVLLDCLTLWVSNILLAHEADPEPVLWQALDQVLAVVQERSLTLVVVTNEVGMGLVPPYALGRRYRDLLGVATQRIAAVANEVYLVVAGIAVNLRDLEAAWVREAQP